MAKITVRGKTILDDKSTSSCDIIIMRNRETDIGAKVRIISRNYFDGCLEKHIDTNAVVKIEVVGNIGMICSGFNTVIDGKCGVAHANRVETNTVAYKTTDEGIIKLKKAKVDSRDFNNRTTLRKYCLSDTINNFKYKRIEENLLNNKPIVVRIEGDLDNLNILGHSNALVTPIIYGNVMEIRVMGDFMYNTGGDLFRKCYITKGLAYEPITIENRIEVSNIKPVIEKREGEYRDIIDIMNYVRKKWSIDPKNEEVYRDVINMLKQTLMERGSGLNV